MKKLKNLYDKKQIIKFILVGIINTIFGYGLYALFIYIGFHYFYATLFATILGVVFNFKTTGKIVFNSSENRLIYKFVIVYICIFLLNLSIIKFFKYLTFDDYMSGLFAIVFCAIVSFVLSKIYVFRS